MPMHALALLALMLVAPVSVQAESASPASLELEHVLSIGSQGAGEGQFQYIEDLVLTKRGQLLVADAAHAWVQVFDERTGAFVSRFGGKGDEDHNLEKPEGIAVDAEGNVFVADYITGFIKKYDAAFAWRKTFSRFGAEQGESRGAEFMDIAHDRLYSADAGNHRINVFALSGHFLFSFGQPGAGPGQLNTPEAVKAGPNGRMFVTDLRNDRLQIFDREGAFVETWGASGTDKGRLKSPAGLAADDQGRIYVSEIGNNRLQVFDHSGRVVGMFGRKGSAPGEFDNPHGVAVDPETGLIYVADTGNNRVQVLRAMVASPKPVE